MTVYSDLLWEMEYYGVPSVRALQIAAAFTEAGEASVGFRNPRIEAMERHPVVAPCTCKSHETASASADQPRRNRVVPIGDGK